MTVLAGLFFSLAAVLGGLRAYSHWEDSRLPNLLPQRRRRHRRAALLFVACVVLLLAAARVCWDVQGT